jgi:DNA-binding transcriptional LysR family regulator
MDFKRLQHFIALAEEGRFAAAAQRVHLSAAAFSRSIQALEEDMGLRLFDRGAKGATLTAAGEVVLGRARALVLESGCLQRDIALVRQGDVGEIALGAAPIPAAVLLPQLLCQLRQHSAQLAVRVHLGNLPTLLEQLDAQELDFCLGDPRLVHSTKRYAMQRVGRQEGYLYCRKDHPLLRDGAMDAATMARCGVALISMSPALRMGLAHAYGFASAEALPVAFECDDLHTLMHLARNTDVLALLPVSLAARAPQVLHALPPVHPGTGFADLHAIWLKGRTLAPATLRAIDLACAIGGAPLEVSAA